MKHVTIKLIGEGATGKSTLADLLPEFLTEHAFPGMRFTIQTALDDDFIMTSVDFVTPRVKGNDAGA